MVWVLPGRELGPWSEFPFLYRFSVLLNSGGSNSPWSELWSEFPHFMGMGWLLPSPKRFSHNSWSNFGLHYSNEFLNIFWRSCLSRLATQATPSGEVIRPWSTQTKNPDKYVYLIHLLQPLQKVVQHQSQLSNLNNWMLRFSDGLKLDIFETPVTVTPNRTFQKTLNSSKIP